MQSLEAEGRGRAWGTDMADLSRQGGCESYLLSYHRLYTNTWEKHTLCKPSTLPGKKESLESLRKCIVANWYLSQNKIIIKERFGTHTPPSLRAARTEQGVEEAVGWPRRRTVGARW